jgi:chromate transport protein ChrA
MLLANDVRSDIKAAKKLRLPRWAILPGIVVAFLCAWLFDRFGRLNLMLPIWNGVAVLGLMLALKRKLWRHAWFWGTVAILAALHVPLILYVPWTTKWIPALAIAAIDSGDLIVMLAILAAVGRFVEGRRRLNGGRRRS